MPSVYGHHITVRVTSDGVMVRSGCGDSEVLTADEAEEVAAAVVDAGRWMVGPRRGGAVLTARAVDRCVIVECDGHASRDECERFAAEVAAAVKAARAWVPPESKQTKRNRERRAQRAQLEVVT